MTPYRTNAIDNVAPKVPPSNFRKWIIGNGYFIGAQLALMLVGIVPYYLGRFILLHIFQFDYDAFSNYDGRGYATHWLIGTGSIVAPYVLYRFPIFIWNSINKLKASTYC